MTKPIPHWIDGRPARARPAARPRCSTLRPGGRPPRSPSQHRRGRRRGRGRRGGRRARGGTPRCRKRTAVLFAFRELLHARPTSSPRSSPPSTARCTSDALGEIARGLEIVEFACGVPQLLKGGFSEQASPPASTSTRSGSRWAWSPASPVQLPGDGAAVDVRQRHRVRQRVRPQAEREGPVGVAASGRAVAARPACPTASSTSCTATRRPSTRCSTHPDVAAVSFVGSTPIARYVYETGTAHGKRVQALGGAKNHALVLPDADLDLAADAPSPPATAPPASAAWRSRSPSRSATSPTPLVDALARPVPKLVVGDGTDPAPTWGR